MMYPLMVLSVTRLLYEFMKFMNSASVGIRFPPRSIGRELLDKTKFPKNPERDFIIGEGSKTRKAMVPAMPAVALAANNDN